ncbi:hypothetical protein SRHO_G00198590 [Serrasalmus rhombeus]
MFFFGDFETGGPESALIIDRLLSLLILHHLSTKPTYSHITCCAFQHPNKSHCVYKAAVGWRLVNWPCDRKVAGSIPSANSPQLRCP